MSQYTRDQLKICVAKMCLTIGWHSSMTTPIEILTDIVSNYLYQLGRATTDYANGFGMNHSNVDHLGLVFRDFHINLPDLEDYVKNVDCIEPSTTLPKYPIPKEDHLNFLKPGSKEVVTRQVHVHEHLPPMHPVLEVNQSQLEASTGSETTQDVDVVENTSPVFKRPPEVSRPRLLLEDEGRPTREISSVMMTTSGFLSPAREGKLPESRTPMPALEPIVLPPALPPEPSDAAPNKKFTKTTKKLEKKKGKVGKELFKPLGEQKHLKKLTNSKDNVKSKVKHASNAQTPVQNFAMLNDVISTSLVAPKTSSNAPQKFNKALAAARLKTEKLNTTITPILAKTPVAPLLVVKTEPHVDKLFTEPDKRKINILKKISVKNEKLSKTRDEIKQESRESSPDLIIDESANEAANKVHHLSNDLTIELVDIVDSVAKNQDKPERLFYDESPPGTPSTPKTPEMISQSPPLNKIEKRKRKDKSKVKKIQKINSPVRLDHDVIDIDMERPKTPEAHLVMAPDKTEIPAPTIPFPFFSSFAGPSLIPPPLGKSLFSHLGIPPLSMTGFGQTPYISPVHSNVPMNFMQSIKQEEVMQKSPQPSKPATITNPAALIESEASPKLEKKNKEHKKDKKDKLKKKNKKDKIKNKAEKKKLKEEKKDKEKIKKEKREKRKEKEVREGETVVPKLTLKLGSASPHSDSTETRKLNIKPIIKKEEEPTENKDIKDIKREMSPELAKISALVTGQPKPKSTNIPITDTYPSSSNDSFNMKKSMFKPIPKIRTKEIPKEPEPSYAAVDQYNNTSSCYTDAVGNTVWYCPACGKQDDGSPMIGCDDCDAWYHWVCVGIQIPPDESENWYCRNCISKKQEVLQTDKKKKRKKREKKEH